MPAKSYSASPVLVQRHRLSRLQPANFARVICDLMQKALLIFEECCIENGLDCESSQVRAFSFTHL